MEHLNAMGLKVEDFGCSDFGLLKKVFNEEVKILEVRAIEKQELINLIITLPKKKSILNRSDKKVIIIYPWDKSNVVLANRKMDALAHYLFSKLLKERENESGDKVKPNMKSYQSYKPANDNPHLNKKAA